MAKQEITYVCEVCGMKFQSRIVAEECENQHYKAIEITNFTYDKNENKKEFPITINVRLRNENGKEKIITYSRK